MAFAAVLLLQIPALPAGSAYADAEAGQDYADEAGIANFARTAVDWARANSVINGKGGSVLTENYVGAHFADYDSYLILSRFKGHAMAGFGGAIKSISIGIGSSEGKSRIYSGGTSKRGISGNQDASLVNRVESRNGLYTLEHAVEIGLGSRDYELVSLDS